jgi:aspartyl/asparaginyl beta-hydroxylase (cupin superfamily)
VCYPEIAAVCPELRRLEQHFAVIRTEYQSIRNRLQQVPRYHDVDPLQYELSNSPTAAQNWRVFFLDAMGRKARANRAFCPQTAALVDGIPTVFQAFFSILEGGKSLPAHRSPYWGYLRYHLALEVPASGPAPRMRVKDQWLSWEEGKAILFDDSWEHELINENSKLRSVLIVDIARPTNKFGRAVHRLSMLVMRHTYAWWLLRRRAGRSLCVLRFGQAWFR